MRDSKAAPVVRAVPGDSNRAPQTGFTIVETLIVLAIAGLILLIVFEAIPALTRSSRNNQRRQDVSAVLQAVSRYELNNSGNFPASVATLLQFTTLSYYTSANVTLHGQGSPAQATVAAGNNINSVDIWDYEKCDTNNSGSASTQGTDYTSVVAIFAVEDGSGGAVGQCQQL
jgi:prepilin-type N-terminal cleavage/methylation domain-containing protein